MKIEEIKDISRVATLESSLAISQLVHNPVSVEISTETIIDIGKSFDFVLVEEGEMAVVSHILSGDVKGKMSLILPHQSLLSVASQLLKKELSPTPKLSEEVKNAIEEFSNILMGNYLKYFSRKLGLGNLLHNMGVWTWSTRKELVRGILSSSDFKQGNYFLISIIFCFPGSGVSTKGYVEILFDVKSLEGVGLV